MNRAAKRNCGFHRVWMSLGLTIAALACIVTTSRAETSTVVYNASTGYIRNVYIGRIPGVPVGTGERLLFVEHDTGVYPDPLVNKVDVGGQRLVANHKILITPDSLVLRAGSGETGTIELAKCYASENVLWKDSTTVFIGLYPVINGAPALPGTSAAGQPSHGLLQFPAGMAFRGGFCHVQIQASVQPSEDVLLIAQPGLEPVFVPVFYR